MITRGVTNPKAKQPIVKRNEVKKEIEKENNDAN